MNIIQKIANYFSGRLAGMKAAFIGSSSIGAPFGIKNVRWMASTYDNLARLAFANAYSNRGMVLIADMFSSVPVQVRTTTNDKNEYTEDHSLIKLLANPRQGWSRRVLFTRVAYHLLIGGEFFLRRLTPTTGPNVGRAIRLKLYSPRDLVEIHWLTEAPDEVDFYTFRNRIGQVTNVPAEECLHFMLYNPLDEFAGMPILHGAKRAMETMAASEDWNRSLAEDRGRVPGFFIRTERSGIADAGPNARKTEADREQMQREWRRDARNSTPGVLNYGWDWKDVSKTPKDADWAEGERAQMRKIAVALGVDPALMGDNQNRTVNNMQEAVKALLTLRVLPLLELVLDSLTAFFQQDLMPGEVLAYNADDIAFLQEELAKKWERIVAANAGSLLTADESRSVLGWPTLGGAADVLFANANRVPLEELASMANLSKEERSIIEQMLKRADQFTDDILQPHNGQ